MSKKSFLLTVTIIAVVSAAIFVTNTDSNNIYESNNLDSISVSDKTELRLVSRNVESLLETDELSRGAGDVADDVAIWRNQNEPDRSVVVATNKASNGGLLVYNLSGNLIQDIEIEFINNVDLKENVDYQGRSIVLVASTGRTTNKIFFHELDKTTRKLSPIAEVTLSYEPYGVCMWQPKSSEGLYMFVTDNNSGKLEQYDIVSLDNGSLSAILLEKAYPLGGKSEGCVADDFLNTVYVAEERKALWRYNADPDSAPEKTQIDTDDNGGNIGFDLEGVTIVELNGSQGYIILSRQGLSEFVVYSRQSNEHLGQFKVFDGSDKHQVSHTDGLDASTGYFNDKFPKGLLVVHDHFDPELNTSNYKYISLKEVLNLQ